MSYAKDPRDRNMISYLMFARKDAYALTEWLLTDFDVAAVQDAFEALGVRGMVSFESAAREDLADLIRRPQSQRRAFLRKLCKDRPAHYQGLMVVFAIIGLLRVEAMLDLRDRYRYALTPGDSNRETCADIYSFHQDVIRIPPYDWPAEMLDVVSDGLGL